MHKLTVALGIVVTLLLTMSIAQAGPRWKFATYYENRGSSSGYYYGTDANWVEKDWNLSCPGNNRVNFVAQGVAVGSHTQDGSFLQVGYNEVKDRDSQGRCSTLRYHFWERFNATNMDNYGFGAIKPGVNLGTDRKYTMSRLSSGCAPGKAWCWHFKINDGTRHTCCGEVEKWRRMAEVGTQLECSYYTEDFSSCPAQARLTFDHLEYKPTGDAGSWPLWAGRDTLCVHKGAGMRGRWVDAANGAAGIKVDIPSTQGCV